MFAAWLWETEHWHFVLTPAAVDELEGEFLEMLLPTGRNHQAKQTTGKIPLQEAKEQPWLSPHLKINRSFSYDFPLGLGFHWLFGGGLVLGWMVCLVLKHLFKAQKAAAGIKFLFLWRCSECACSKGSSHTTSAAHTAQPVPPLGQIWVQEARN